MPITQSAKKALRGSEKKKLVNDRRKKALKETIKEVEKLAKIDKASAKKSLAKAYSAIDKAAKTGVIKKNTASRKKARLSRASK
ncbi:30S ribosomal protein S20 [Candidatus Nomurabacteria bacterium]|nr:30S ribosomal protein S20 [Candidatus Nomurabacteria bacterium]